MYVIIYDELVASGIGLGDEKAVFDKKMKNDTCTCILLTATNHFKGEVGHASLDRFLCLYVLVGFYLHNPFIYKELFPDQHSKGVLQWHSGKMVDKETELSLRRGYWNL